MVAFSSSGGGLWPRDAIFGARVSLSSIETRGRSRPHRLSVLSEAVQLLLSPRQVQVHTS